MRETFVIRYLSQSGKGLSASEASQLHAAGKDIGLVYESGATTAMGGWSAGVQDAHVANALANSLNVPSSVAIYFAIDWDVSVAQLGAVQAYFNGVNSASSRPVGVYGSNRVVNSVSAKYFWCTYAWSGGAGPVGKAHLYQYENDITLYGAQVDRDRSLQAAWGQWYAHAPVSNDLLAWAAANPSAFKQAVKAGLHG